MIASFNNKYCTQYYPQPFPHPQYHLFTKKIQYNLDDHKHNYDFNEFGHNKLLQPPATNSFFVTLRILWPLATTNGHQQYYCYSTTSHRFVSL